MPPDHQFTISKGGFDGYLNTTVRFDMVVMTPPTTPATTLATTATTTTTAGLQNSTAALSPGGALATAYYLYR